MVMRDVPMADAPRHALAGTTRTSRAKRPGIDLMTALYWGARVVCTPRRKSAEGVVCGAV